MTAPGPGRRPPASGSGARAMLIGAIAVVMVAALVVWLAGDRRGSDGPVYMAAGVFAIALTTCAHVLAMRHPERPTLDGTAWVLAIISGTGALGALYSVLSITGY